MERGNLCKEVGFAVTHNNPGRRSYFLMEMISAAANSFMNSRDLRLFRNLGFSTRELTGTVGLHWHSLSMVIVTQFRSQSI